VVFSIDKKIVANLGCIVILLRFLLVILLLQFGCYSLHSRSAHSSKKAAFPKEFNRLKIAVHDSDFTLMGKLAREAVHNREQLKKLKTFARNVKSTKLFRAARFALLIDAKKENLQLNPGELVQIVLFIESKLPKLIAKGEKFFQPAETGLKRALEYDPQTGKTFILLDGVKGSYIGEGCRKTVTKAILYNYEKPQIVARGVQMLNARELRVSKILQGGAGLFKTRALTQRTEQGKELATIYSTIYNPGSFKTITEKGISFTLREKMKIVQGILIGLDTMHKRKVVHRDLGLGNYLISITKTQSGKRKVSAVISDFGSSMEITRASRVIPQANTIYTAPEGLFFQNMLGADYYSTDIFAAGCAFYNLFYGEMPAWTNRRYLRITSKPVEQNYKELIEKIDSQTKVRRDVLGRKKVNGLLTRDEEFEYLILRMVHPDHTKRGSASHLKIEMQRILNLKKPAKILPHKNL
jgi:serine/threonine protein kinase